MAGQCWYSISDQTQKPLLPVRIRNLPSTPGLIPKPYTPYQDQQHNHPSYPQRGWGGNSNEAGAKVVLTTLCPPLALNHMAMVITNKARTLEVNPIFHLGPEVVIYRIIPTIMVGGMNLTNMGIPSL